MKNSIQDSSNIQDVKTIKKRQKEIARQDWDARLTKAAMERETATTKRVHILNSLQMSGHKCALCGSHIDQKADRRLPLGFNAVKKPNPWDSVGLVDTERYKFEGLNFPYHTDDRSLETAIRLLSRLCYPCFARHWSHLYRGNYIAPEKSLFNEIKKQLNNEKTPATKIVKPILTDERRLDLLALILLFVARNYALPPKNRELSCHRVSGVAEYYRASTIYRRLRKKLRLKGHICNGAQTVFVFRVDIFHHKTVAEIQQHAIENPFQSPSQRFSNSYKWQERLHELAVRGDEHGFFPSISLSYEDRIKWLQISRRDARYMQVLAASWRIGKE